MNSIPKRRRPRKETVDLHAWVHQETYDYLCELSRRERGASFAALLDRILAEHKQSQSK